MSLSDKLAAKVREARAAREEQLQSSEPFRPNWGVAAAVFAGVTLVIAAHMPPVPAPVVTAPAPAPVTAAAPDPAEAWKTAGMGQPGGPATDTDPFTEKWDRIGAEIRAEQADHSDAERVKQAATDRMRQSMLERCDRDWLPSTCAKLRAEFAASGY